MRAGGRVVAHVLAIALSDVTLHVGQRPRERVLRTGRREVHAWASGTLTEAAATKGMVEVGYSPFIAGFFTSRPGFRKVVRAKLLVFTDTGKAYALID